MPSYSKLLLEMHILMVGLGVQILLLSFVRFFGLYIFSSLCASSSILSYSHLAPPSLLSINKYAIALSSIALSLSLSQNEILNFSQHELFSEAAPLSFRFPAETNFKISLDPFYFLLVLLM